MPTPVESKTRCPEPVVLAQLLVGKLPAGEAELVEQHLLGCSQCAAAAQTLSAHDTLTDAMRSYQPFPADELAAIERLADRMQSEHGAGSSAAVIDLPAAGEPNLFARLARVLQPEDEPASPAKPGDTELYDFLAPAEAEDELGRLGPYRIMKVLGSGGMGVVFLAEDLELKRRVALKAMHPALAASTSARERFQREAQAMAAIEHEHIVTIFHVGRDRGVPYLAMPLLDGQTLDQLEPGRPLPVDDVVRIGHEIALGLDAAHRRGLIHRDIKPGNVFLERSTGRVKLLDFGLARAVDGDAQLTRQGAIVGTPAFMSPEQARGETTDARSDLFSLGCVLYLLATGTSPFLGATPSAVVAAVLDHQPEPPQSLRREIPAGLSELILRLLAKSREARPASAAAVAEELLQCTQRDPAARPAPAPPRRLTPWMAAAACLLAIVASPFWAPPLYRFVTNQGVLIVETDDKDIEVKVKVSQEGHQVDVLDRATGNSLTLKAGSYQVALVNDRNDVRMEKDTVTVTRGGKQVLRIVRQVNVAESKPSPPAANIAANQPAADGKPGYLGRFLGHTDQVSRVAISADGKQALTGSLDKTARLWDVATGKELRRFTGHTGSVSGIALTPDGRYALTGEGDSFEGGKRIPGTDFSLHLWDLQTGDMVRRFEGHRNEIVDLCISADGRWAVSGSQDSTLRMWDIESGQETRRFECHTAVWAVAISRDNRRVLAGCPKGDLLLVDMQEEREIRRFAGHTDHVTSVAWSPDESHFVSSSDDGQPRIWNVQDGTARLLPKHPNDCVSAAYTPDGEFVMTSCNDRVVRMFESTTLKLVHRFEGHTAAATKLAVSADSRLLLSTSADTTVRLWRLPEAPMLQPPAQFGPTPLEEWLKGRKIVTVSQSGAADYKTIEAALKSLQMGQVVEVLDRGPYREVFEIALPEDVGLISRAGTRIELKSWRPTVGVDDPKKHRYLGCQLSAPRGLRISGLEFAGPKLPGDAETGTLFNLRAAGDVIVERCRFLHDPRYGIVPPDSVDPELVVFVGLSADTYLEAPKRPCRLHYDRNLIEGEIFIRFDYPAPVTIERCRLPTWRWAAMSLHNNAGAVVVRHNVIHANAGLNFNVRHPHTSYLVANNLFDRPWDPVVFYSGEKPPQRPQLPRNVRIENNIVRSGHNEGFNVNADEAVGIQADWRVGHNCFAAAPVPARQVAPFPMQPSDLIHLMPFASIDTSDPDYLLPAADGPLASGGAGGDLPNYIGPLAPSRDAPENAWFAELNRDWMQEVGPRLKPDDIAAPPPLDQWLKGRTVRTVAQDGSAEFKTIGEALAALKEGQVVQVLDQGPYRESINLAVPPDTGLVSTAGTQLEFPGWQPYPAAATGKSNYSGIFLTVDNAFRISGIKFTGPKLPDDTEVAWPIQLDRMRGRVTVEDCVVLHNPPYPLTLTPPDSLEAYRHHFIGLNVNNHYRPRSAPLDVCVRDCWIDGYLNFTVQTGGSLLLERNCIVGWRYETLLLPQQAGDVIVRHNVIAGWNGPAIRQRDAEPAGTTAAGRYLFANNLMTTVSAPVVAWSLAPGGMNDLASPPKNVRIENNVSWSRESSGIVLSPVDWKAVQGAWQVGHNGYLAEPGPRGVSPAFPRRDTDRVDAKPFLSDEQDSADFLRIPVNGSLATGGAGGDLPSYMGAFPPGPQQDDWFSRLRRVSKQPAATKPSVSIATDVKPGFIRRFYGHKEYIGYVEFSSDGRWAVSSGFDKTARLWNVATGEEIRKFSHNGGVCSITLSAGGKQLLTGQGDWFDKGARRPPDDYDLRLWDVESGQLQKRLEGHRGEVVMVCLSQDGRRAVSAGVDKTVRLWDLESGREVHRYDCQAAVFGLALARDNRRVLAGCTDGVILLLDIEAERQIGRFEGHTANVPYVAFSPDETQFVSATDDREPRIWDVQSGQSRKLPKHPGVCVCAVFTPDGKSVLTSCADGVVRLWEAATAKLVHRFEGHTGPVTGLAVSPDGRLALSASADTTIRLWGLPKGATLAPPKQFGATPLDEWLKGRKIVTVSKSGKADHTTIEAALKGLKKGEVVEVLDRGPYRETFTVTLPEDVGLVSQAGARIELSSWQQLGGAQNPKKNRYWGWIVLAPRGLRLSGIEFACAKLPSDTEDATAIGLRVAGDLVVDQCRVLHNPRYGIVKPDNDDPELFQHVGLAVEPFKEQVPEPTRVLYDQNLVEGALFVRLDYPAPVTIQRCLLFGWRWDAGKLMGKLGPVVIRHNLVHANAGFQHYSRSSPSLIVANNLFQGAMSPMLFWAPGKPPERHALPRQVRIENNIIRAFGAEGFNVMPDEATTVAADWRVGHNCYDATPVAVRDIAPVPLAPSDLVNTAPFASIDTNSPDYLLPLGPLAKGGAGGDLPDYIGPLAPSADAAENAWFAELMRDWKHEPRPHLKPDEVAAPPALAEWLKGRTLRTVAQDGSAEFKTIGEALAALKEGEVVQVLDQGPYRETLEGKVPANTGLVSEVGTTIEIPQWRPVATVTPGKSNYFATNFVVTDGFRLSGFRIRGPKLPDNTDVAWGIALNSARGEVTVEDCAVLHDFPRYTFTAGSHEVYPHWFRSLEFNKDFAPRDLPTTICMRNNWLEGVVSFDGHCRASLLIERNCILGWRNDALILPRSAVDVVIKHNVIFGWYGIELFEREGGPAVARPAGRYAIVNNTLYSVGHPVAVLFLPPAPVNDLAAAPRNVGVQNNLIWSRDGAGITLNSGDMSAVGSHWQVGHNAYLSQPRPWGESPAFPPGESDRIVPKPFLSDDQASPDFLRIPADSPLATGGAGGDLPGYVGAFPLGAAQPGDWFSRLRAKAER